MIPNRRRTMPLAFHNASFGREMDLGCNCGQATNNLRSPRSPRPVSQHVSPARQESKDQSSQPKPRKGSFNFLKSKKTKKAQKAQRFAANSLAFPPPSAKQVKYYMQKPLPPTPTSPTVSPVELQRLSVFVGPAPKPALRRSRYKPVTVLGCPDLRATAAAAAGAASPALPSSTAASPATWLTSPVPKGTRGKRLPSIYIPVRKSSLKATRGLRVDTAAANKINRLASKYSASTSASASKSTPQKPTAPSQEEMDEDWASVTPSDDDWFGFGAEDAPESTSPLPSIPDSLIETEVMETGNALLVSVQEIEAGETKMVPVINPKFAVPATPAPENRPLLTPNTRKGRRGGIVGQSFDVVPSPLPGIPEEVQFPEMQEEEEASVPMLFQMERLTLGFTGKGKSPAKSSKKTERRPSAVRFPSLKTIFELE
jgi:hypothetical protein